MPSGAKKRKAAKKKQGKESNNSTDPAFHSQGDDGVKTHDENENDGGEVSSPMSQDHLNHQHQFTEGGEEEVEKREDASSARSFVLEKNSIEGFGNNGESMQKGAMEEEGVVQIDSNLKPEDESEGKSISIESHDKGSSTDDGSSSSSSSDDESHVVEKNVVVVESGESKEENYCSSLDAASFVDTIKPVDSLSKLVTQITDIPVEGAYNLVVETAPVIDSDKVSLVEEVVQVTESAPVVDFVSSDVVESGLKENAEKKLPSEDKSAEASSIYVDSGSQNKEDKMVLTSDENAAATSDAMGFAAQEDEDKLLLSLNAARVENGNGAECIKDSEIPECSDNQPQVASTTQPVQTSFWKGCCGLFEVFTGSNR
ncbi:uncharacterized protein LOC132310925 [Cornus florida]|uniref:uncharacterized protein LOC132310925 n=1 Tax=Cornus florida TaxID=4283 RepID=UPI00289D0D9F|nr:uncharacterized protein LOC132310925 [Cornus florida]